MQNSSPLLLFHKMQKWELLMMILELPYIIHNLNREEASIGRKIQGEEISEKYRERIFT
jgi:hypothetical protein